MIPDVEEIRRRLAEAIDQMPTTDAATLSTDFLHKGADYIRDFLVGRKKSLPAPVLSALETKLGLAHGRLSLDAIDPTPPRRLFQRRDPEPSSYDSGTLPVYAAAEGGQGHMVLTTDPVEFISAPPTFAGVKNAYALLVVGNSMSKVFRQGDMALVHPGLPMRPDEVHILYDRPPFGEPGDLEVMIKTVLRWNDKVLHLEQYNPAREFDVDRADWPVVHRVIGRLMPR